MFIPKIPFEILPFSEIQNLETFDFADKKTEGQWGGVTAKPQPVNGMMQKNRWRSKPPQLPREVHLGPRQCRFIISCHPNAKKKKKSFPFGELLPPVQV